MESGEPRLFHCSLPCHFLLLPDQFPLTLSMLAAQMAKGKSKQGELMQDRCSIALETMLDLVAFFLLVTQVNAYIAY